MELQQILENNRLIAEFMGWQSYMFNHLPDRLHNTEKELSCNLDHFKYITDWNDLMGVIEKIESFGYCVMINEWSSVYSRHEGEICSCWDLSKIENTYNVVVGFIKYLNNKTEKSKNNVPDL